MPSAVAAIVQVMTERFGALPTAMARTARNPLTCPVPLLGHLAWSRGLDYWGDWTEAEKRAVILQTPANLRVRGTRAAIETALAPFADDLTIEEWFEQTPEGPPGTGMVTIPDDSPWVTDPVAQDMIVRLLARESRKSIHWTVAPSIPGVASTFARATARVTQLAQFDGVQTGA